MPWSTQRECLDPRTVKVTLSAGSALSYDEVIQLWQGDEGFRRFFTEAVLDSGFEAFFWETPPVTLSTLGRPLEFVVVEGGALARLRPDPQPFSKHFAARSCPEDLSFPNLGGDATLIVPAPVSSDPSCYTHLGNFLRAAPAGQVDPPSPPSLPRLRRSGRLRRTGRGGDDAAASVRIAAVAEHGGDGRFLASPAAGLAAEVLSSPVLCDRPLTRSPRRSLGILELRLYSCVLPTKLRPW